MAQQLHIQRVNMNYLIGLERNNGRYSGEIICSTIGREDDQVNVKLDRNGLRDGEAGSGHICWLFAQGYTAAAARREMCFHAKPPETTTSFPATNAVNQLGGV